MLNRLALRICTVRALRGRTYAGAAVFDSDTQPIEEFATDQPRPALVVYTDDCMTAHQGRNLYHTSSNDRVGSGYQKLVIEIVVTQRMRVNDEGGVERTDVVQPHTDPAMAMMLDIIERQITDALMLPSPWQAMWQQFALTIGDRQSQLGSAMRDGVRFAGRQVTFDVRLPIDPPPRTPIGPTWTAFLALAETDPDLTQVASVLRSLVDNPEASDWDEVRATFGLTDAEARSIERQPPFASPSGP